MSFPLWSAFIAAGATPDHLLKLDKGEYPIPFQAKVIAWHQTHISVNLHQQDALDKAQARKSRSK